MRYGLCSPPVRLLAGLCIVGAIGVVFVAVTALPYLRVTEEQFRFYWPRRWWLLLHLASGTVALLSGPVQLWLGLTARRLQLHRRLGMTYAASVAVSASAAYYLAFHTDFGWVFGAGLSGLATAWIVTTGLALVAIRRHLYEQHKEWMIRSYVVTTAFVSFRVLFDVLEAAGVGTVRGEAGRCGVVLLGRSPACDRGHPSGPQDRCSGRLKRPLRTKVAAPTAAMAPASAADRLG